jgi:DMSO/TMAO reductase YedYZ heme-binding membrane subunit
MININYKHTWIAFLISLFVFALCGLELSARREWEINFYLTNKVVASTAILMICLSFLLSTLKYFWKLFTQQQFYARYLGLIGFSYAIIHVILSLFVTDPKEPSVFKFPFPEFYLEKWPSIICGFIGFIIFLNMVRVSIIPAYSRDRWKKQLYYGYFGVLLILSHLILLKYQAWFKWFMNFEPFLPPLSLVVTSIVFISIFLKITQLGISKKIK